MPLTGAWISRGAARGGQRLEHGRVDVDGEQIGPDLVVQVAGEVGALLVLQLDELFLEQPVAPAHAVELAGHQR